MTPKVRPLFSYAKRDGKYICALEVPTMDIADRHCYYSGKERLKGSYLRVGTNDEPMSEHVIYSCEAYAEIQVSTPGFEIIDSSGRIVRDYYARDIHDFHNGDYVVYCTKEMIPTGFAHSETFSLRYIENQPIASDFVTITVIASIDGASGAHGGAADVSFCCIVQDGDITWYTEKPYL